MFSWTRGLELARRFAVYSGILLFLIAFAAAAVIWAHRSQGARPYFLYVSDAGEWAVYGENSVAGAEVPWYRNMQESIAIKYASDFFRISNNLVENNETLWCKCGDSCGENWNKCRLCCMSDQNTFDEFYNRVLPDWRKRFGAGETMSFSKAAAAPAGEITERAGFWKVSGELSSGKSGAKKIIAFVKVARARDGFDGTLGYYISGFDFYVDR